MQFSFDEECVKYEKLDEINVVTYVLSCVNLRICLTNSELMSETQNVQML